MRHEKTVTEVNFTQNTMSAELFQSGAYTYVNITPVTPRYEAADVDTSIEDDLEITCEDGEKYTFKVKIVYTNNVELAAEEEIYSFPMNTPTYLVVEFRDKCDVLTSTITDSVKVTQTSGTDVIKMWDHTIQGKKIMIPIHTLKTGTSSFRVTYNEGYFEKNLSFSVSVTSQGTQVTDPDSLTKPGETPADPAEPSTPGGSDDPGDDTPGSGGSGNNGGSSDDNAESVESPSDNAANSEATISVIEDAIVALATGAELPASAVTATTAAGTSVTAIPVKLTSGSANILTETASLVGTGRVALDISVDNGAMEVLLPGGFGAINEPGRIYYPFNFVSNPTLGGTMRLFVKEKDAVSETVKAGGNMTLPTTATVTLKTKLTGTVNIYYYNEETGRFTKLATVTPKDGKITFATKQMGHMLITTGTI